MKKLSAVLLCFTLCLATLGCATGSSPPETTVEKLQKSIIVLHESLYVPVMTDLGKRLDAGHISPTLEAKIQRASEAYQAAKTAADFVIQTWGAAGSETDLRAKLAAMLAAIAELQTAQNSTSSPGGGSARTLIIPGRPGEPVTACYDKICISVDLNHGVQEVTLE